MTFPELVVVAQGDNSGLVTMLLVGGAVFPLMHASIAWNWRFSVRDELAAQKASGENQGACASYLLWV